MSQFWTVILFQSGYNTNVVLIGASILGFIAGVVGVFIVLSRRALVSDAVSHATLPGICLAFFVNIDGERDFGLLLIGAAATAFLGLWTIQWITQNTRLPQDAAIGSVLSVFFGLGLVLLSVIQHVPGGSKAGLDSFLLGRIASLTLSDVGLIAGVGGGIGAACVLCFKRFQTACFDPDYSESLGWSRTRSLGLMMGLMVGVVCLGITLVGVILIIALLIIPPLSARFWTNRLSTMVWLSGGFGAGASFFGTALSAVISDMPTGGAIVVSAAVAFVFSLAQRTFRRTIYGYFSSN